MSDAKMIKTIYLKAPRELVWAYLTEPDKLARWFHESDIVLASKGDKYRLLKDNPSDGGDAICWGTVREADKPNRLVYSFTHDHLQGVETNVEWVLVESFGGTQLTMTHTGLDVSDEMAFGMLSAHDKGWDEHFARLRTVASTG